MVEVLELLKSLDARLSNIEIALTTPNLNEALTKSHYSCSEVAELTQRFGTKPAKEFTIRLACSDGRISEAEKYADGRWRIPREAVVRIVSKGLPPERRKHN